VHFLILLVCVDTLSVSATLLAESLYPCLLMVDGVSLGYQSWSLESIVFCALDDLPFHAHSQSRNSRPFLLFEGLMPCWVTLSLLRTPCSFVLSFVFSSFTLLFGIIIDRFNIFFRHFNNSNGSVDLWV
jgi:hypothetical protein